MDRLQGSRRGRLVRIAYGTDGALRVELDETDAAAPPLQVDPSFTGAPPPPRRLPLSVSGGFLLTCTSSISNK